MKRFAKTAINLCCIALILPAFAACRIQALFLGRDQAFAAWTQFMSLLPGVSGVFLRRAFLKLTARACSENVSIGFGTIFSHAGISFGRTAYIGNFCSIGDVTIEDDVLIASHVSIMNGSRQHGTERLDTPIREQAGTFERITIGQDSWIGERATIAANIGRHCIIGAGAIVTQPVPDYAIAVGVPARVIRDRREPERVIDAESSLDHARRLLERAVTA